MAINDHELVMNDFIFDHSWAFVGIRVKKNMNGHELP